MEIRKNVDEKILPQQWRFFSLSKISEELARCFRGSDGGEDPKLDPILIEGEEKWDVHKVPEKRTKNGTLEYRIRWLDPAPWKDK